MLARATKSYPDAVKRCKNGMRVEIKVRNQQPKDVVLIRRQYDGERLQIHKKGDSFKVRV